MNIILIAPLCAWTVAQLLKVLTVLVQEKQLDFRYFVSSGGMPSAHSAVVTALSTSVFIIEGADSTAFAISAILALIVMYDAAGVRRAVGRQSTLLNRLVREFRHLKDPNHMVVFEHDLREFIGHTPFQVIVGGIIGVLIAWLWTLI